MKTALVWNTLRARRFATLFILAVGYASFVYLSTPTYALPPNFQDTVVWSGLTLPTAVRFAPDGRVFVAEKAGIIKVFDSIADPTPTVLLDLRPEVLSVVDLGLLGLAVDPGFPARPYIYALYTVDAPPGIQPPFYNDVCNNTNNCLNYSRLLRISVDSASMMVTGQQVLHDGWCKMTVYHSVGDLNFGNDGFLYVSHGDGASPAYVDFGQTNSCAGDPALEGGALRSQDIRTTGDTVTYSGSIIRINPDTGAAAPGNPLAGGAIADDDPIVATGLRNPFRFSIDRLTGRLWIGDVGLNDWEELNTVASPITSVANFGWPCYEGMGPQPSYGSSNLPICETLYGTTLARAPYYTYIHAGASAAITGVALYRGSNFPAAYDGALFFADYARGWIKVMAPGSDGLPNKDAISDFVPAGAPAVDLQVGPTGELFYVDIYNGRVRKIAYTSTNTPPIANITADVTAGPLPLTVHFDGSMSHDPDAGDSISYSWDLNGDGVFGDAAGSMASITYTTAGGVSAKLRVTDSKGGIDTAVLVIAAGATAPIATIAAPSATATYRVGDMVSFSGSALDPDTNQELPPSALSWRVFINHCYSPTDCHEHFQQQYPGVTGWTIQAPDHEYPAFLRFELTATKPATGSLPALSTVVSRSLMPQTTTVTLNTVPSGLQLSIYGSTVTTPVTRTMIVNAQTTVIAPTPQGLGGMAYQFGSWSDGGTQTHFITATPAPTTLTATYDASALPWQSVWNSWDVVTQSGTPQGVVTAAVTGATAVVEFYESVNNAGVLKSGLFGSFTTAPHPGTFNNLERYWGPGTGNVYPYAGKSLVNRGADVGEASAPMPLGVRDLQLHPPQNQHMVVAAFRAPSDGTYTVTNLGVRRVSNLGSPVTFRVINSQQVEIAALQATANRAWVTSPSSYTLTNVPAGAYLYFAVDNAGDFAYDATEIAWTVTAATGPPPPQPSCTLSATPTSIDQGLSTTLVWTATNATSLSIDHGVGSVMPVAGSSIMVTPSIPTQYTATATGPGGSVTCATTVTVIPSASAPTSVWNSWEVVPQSGTPQGLVTAATSGIATSLEFYESTNNAGVLKGALFAAFTTAAHPGTFNNLERYWGPGTGNVYPYAGKSLVNRGADVGEANAPMPVGVQDLQLHPPQNQHMVVAAFRAPTDGTYTITNLGVRRVSNLGGPVTLRVINPQQMEIAALQATANRTWVTSPTAYTLPNVTAGAYLYFAVDNAGDFAYDATEIAWTITAGTGSQPPTPSCTLGATPTSIDQGLSTTLVWTATNATGLSIDHGVGVVMPVVGGSTLVTPSITTPYTATVTGPGGSATCATTVTVIPSSSAPTSVWNSWEVVTQSGTPQGLVTATATGVAANLEFYESTNNAGVLKGALFGGFTTAAHPGTFNNLERYWGPNTGNVYPYVGKSLVNRGADVGEANAPMPVGVRDLQLHPPQNQHMVVAAFRAPTDGTYTVTNLGVRRVSNLGGPVTLRVINSQQVEIAALQATANRAWVTSPSSYTLTNVTAGAYLYFAVDNAGDFAYDATEIAWTVTRSGP